MGDLSNSDALNTLENENNPFRVIFAVAKLSEGWDVLNLYDIVRLGEQPTKEKQTDQEVQLIGRGARYYPFKYKGKRSFTRRFDNSSEENQLLEKLFYHTINDPVYLKNLNKSLDKIELPVEDDTDFNVYTAKVKSKFKASNAYKNGLLYYNKLEDVPSYKYDDLSSYGINTTEIYEMSLVNSTFETSIYENKERKASTELRRAINFVDDIRLVKKGFSRNKFYRFNNLKRKFQ